MCMGQARTSRVFQAARPGILMRNIKLILEYDGTDYHGWQIQPGARTIEGALRGAIRKVLGEEVKCTSSGRTDAGVHALGHVANFHSSSAMPPDKMRYALNSVLPDEIAIRHLEDVHDNFHARFDALGKRYRYTMTTVKHPLTRKYVYRIRRYPDVEAIRHAMRNLRGKLDFRAFCRIRELCENTVCDVRDISLREERGFLILEIEADRFLHHMVRTIVGTLLQVGWGAIESSRMGEILAGGDRREAGPTAPSCGLILVKVYY